MKNLRSSIIAILFLMTILFTPAFAQDGDADGDGVLDSQDLCPREKGTKENKGCPSKNADANKKVVQAENPTDLGNSFADLCVSGNCVNGKGKKAYAIGDIYEGDWVNGKREGQGTQTELLGSYSGQWKNDEYNGYGKLEKNFLLLEFGDDYTYEGIFVNGKREGQGTSTLKNGDLYTGEWKNDKQNGYGREYIKATMAMREGTWKDGVFAGTKAATSTPTTSTTTPVVVKTGILADCKIVLSEGCRNYLLQAKASDILPQFEDAIIFQGKELVSNAFHAKIVEATGGILSVEFSGEFKNPFGQPAENVKWGESVEKVKKKFGEPLQIRLDLNRATHIYKNFELVYFVNKLRWITFGRDKTESEIAAEQIFNREKLEAERIANTPQNRAQKLKADAIAAYYETIEQCNRIMGYYNKKVEQGNSQTTRVAQDVVNNWNSYKTAKAVANMRARLQSLLDIHGANLPAEMKEQIEAQLKSLN